MPTYSHFSRAKKLQGGFTLIELMIAIAIMGILAAIAMSIYSAFVASGHNSAAKGDIMAAVTAQQRYFADNNAYGATVAAINFAPQDKVTVLFSVNGTSFNACAKHLNGDKVYGYDSNTGKYYQQNSAKGVILSACPAATAANDFVEWSDMQ